MTAFPVTERYTISFRFSDVGLPVTFALLRRTDTGADVVQPVIYEIGGGTYYFDWLWASATDPDVTFVIDGGASIPTEEIRYVHGTLRPPVVAASSAAGGGGGGGWSVG